MKHLLVLGTLEMVAPAFCATETDQFRQFGHVDRIEPAMVGRDGHHDFLSRLSRCRKQKNDLWQRETWLRPQTADQRRQVTVPENGSVTINVTVGLNLQRGSRSLPT